MRSVTSTGLGRIHKERLNSQNFRKSIGILLLIHNVCFIVIKKKMTNDLLQSSMQLIYQHQFMTVGSQNIK